MDKELRKRALALYRGPFRYDVHGGYIWDARNMMVTDSAGSQEGPEGVAAKVRGWGRIQYMENPEELQDAVGDVIAEALTEYWGRRA